MIRLPGISPQTVNKHDNLIHHNLYDYLNKQISYKDTLGFPSGSEGKESACNVGDPGSIPGLGIFPGERNGNPFQYSCLENPHGHRTAQGI